MPFVPDDDIATVEAPAGRFAPDAPRTGAAAVPTEAEARGKPYTPPAPQAPAAPPTFTQKVTGAVEAGLNLVTGLVGGALGGVTGTAKTLYEGGGAVAGAVSRKMQGLPPEEMAPRPSLLQNQTEQSQGITAGLKRMVSGPMDLREAQTPDTETGQQYTEAMAPAMETAMGAAGLHGTMGPAGGMKAGAEGFRRMAGATPEAGIANAGLQKAGDVARAGARKVLSVDPELAKIAQTAGELKYPIAVRPDQIVEGAKYTKLAGEASSNVPLSGSARADNQVAFTRNLIDMLNPDEAKADRLTPDVFDKAMRRSGEGIGEITARTPVPHGDIAPGLRSVRDGLNKATEENRRIVTEYIGDINRAAEENDGVIDGTRLKEINSEIGAQSRTNVDNDLGRYLNNLQDVVQDAIERNATPEDVPALRDFRRQYAYGKMVEPMVAKTIDGKVSPAELMQRVTATKQGKHYMARSMGGPIGELAKVGKLIKEPSTSNTAERGLVYGVGLGGGAYIEPHTAAAVYGGANVYNRLGPVLTRELVRGSKDERAKPAGEPPPSEPGTTLGAADEDHPRGPAPAGGPLGDLTPDWETSPGASGGPAAPGVEPTGLVPAAGEKPITRFVPDAAAETPRRAAGSEIPAVPGRPDLPDSMLTGRPAESAGTERSNAAMLEPGTQEAMRRAEAQRQTAARAEIPVGETREVAPGEGVAAPKTPKPGSIPTGKATEGQPEIKTSTPKKIPAGEATELAPEVIELGRKWQREYKLGDDEVQRAHGVARAFDHDPEAVAKAADKFDNDPKAFDREIERINTERTAHEDAVNTIARRGASDAGGAAPSAAAPAAPVPEGGKAGEPAAAVRANGVEPGANSPAAAGAVETARPSPVVIREVPGGFEAYQEGKKVGYLKDNLERGQAEQIGENANVEMVKVNKASEGQGVGTALYQAFHDKHGGRILPSGKTEPGAWRRWKAMYPDKVDTFVKSEAQRIKDGADPKLVIGNITDPEVAQRVQAEAQRGSKSK
jgi:hypothetical protein